MSRGGCWDPGSETQSGMCARCMQRILFQCHCILEQFQVQPNICHESKCFVLWLKSLYPDEYLHPTSSATTHTFANSMINLLVPVRVHGTGQLSVWEQQLEGLNGSSRLRQKSKRVRPATPAVTEKYLVNVEPENVRNLNDWRKDCDDRMQDNAAALVG